MSIKTFECDECHGILVRHENSFNNPCNVCGGIKLTLLKQEYMEGEQDKLKEKFGKVYEDIILFLNEWVDIPEEHKKIISIWLIGTYFHKSFPTYPYLFFNAMRGSGKTRLLRIISWLQKNGNGDVLNNPSEPVMFRTAKERGLIFDEFESEKSKDKQIMREILNSCYKKGGKVFRMERQKIGNKEEQVAVGHPLYTPVSMANINGIEDVLADRCITLILDKSINPALVKKMEDFDDNQTLKDLKKQLNELSVELCSVDHAVECIKGWNMYINYKYTSLHTINKYTLDIHSRYTEIYNKIDQTGIFGRNLELFFPLLITSTLIGENVFNDILKIVSGLNTLKKEDEFAESKDVTLIEFISLADRYRFEYVFVNDLANQFKEFVGKTSDENDNWINANWVGAALKRLKLLSDRKRVAKGIMVVLAVDKAKEKMKMFRTEEKPIEVLK